MHHPTDRIIHNTAFVTPVVEHWLEREIAQWIHPIRRPITPWANALTTELHLAPHRLECWAFRTFQWQPNQRLSVTLTNKWQQLDCFAFHFKTVLKIFSSTGKTKGFYSPHIINQFRSSNDTFICCCLVFLVLIAQLVILHYRFLFYFYT